MEPMETPPSAPTREIREPNEDTETQNPFHSYRLVPKGYGGTCVLSQTAHGSSIITHIGAYGCFTTVGVYFAIDEQRCFAAHIDVRVKHGRDGVLFDQRVRSKAMKEELSWLIQSMLERESVEQEWQMNCSEWIGRDVVVVCERILDDEVGALHREKDSRRGKENNLLVSGVVADAVLEWVESTKKNPNRRDSSGTEMVVCARGVTRRYGFVVEHGGDGTNKIGDMLQDCSVEAVLSKGAQRWSWLWDVSERTPSWKRTGM
ncbi:hypothetical protein LTR17_005954 [Elasticomyces elasticus]|nr:hypothetical protein LTR17_005954 [Elasticomyces elasticus]